jgi:hypothetical protein
MKQDHNPFIQASLLLGEQQAIRDLAEFQFHKVRRHLDDLHYAFDASVATSDVVDGYGKRLARELQDLIVVLSRIAAIGLATRDAKIRSAQA